MSSREPLWVARAIGADRFLSQRDGPPYEGFW